MKCWWRHTAAAAVAYGKPGRNVLFIMGAGRQRELRKGAAFVVEEIWRTDPLTLREEVLDRDAMVGRLADAASMERVWMLATLGRVAEASDEGEAVLREADSRFGPLLLLGYVRLHQFYWAGAARLQEEALQLARTPVREAGVRYQIGRRLFEEGRYLDSVREFGWACDLRRTHGCSDTLVTRSVRARDRAFTLFRRTGR